MMPQGGMGGAIPMGGVMPMGGAAPMTQEITASSLACGRSDLLGPLQAHLAKLSF